MANEVVLKVLIADDTASDRMILESLVKKQGHQVISAEDGQQAVDKFEAEQPHLILMDALMPNLDGFDATRKIKALAGETFVPIIFLTSLSDTESLVKCLDAGGDDFLQKPYNPVILQAKIKSFSRMGQLHTTMLTQRDQIQQHNNHLIKEQTVAKEVFDKIAHSGCLDASNVKYFLSPSAVFNGDVLVAAIRPSGSMLVLLGDFTGHGLPAAIGAMPLASTFYGMAHKGFGLKDILREINDKLKGVLPIGVFCCATFLEFDFRQRRLTAWNGGLPDAYIYRQKTGQIEPIKSTHLPLGVQVNNQFRTDCVQYELEVGDRCFMWSDGIHEARNHRGEMYSEERLKNVFANNSDPEQLFDSVIASVQSFVGEQKVDDDLSLVEVQMVDAETIESARISTHSTAVEGLMDWRLEFELKPSTMRAFDPLPLLISIINEVPGLRTHNTDLYTILAELYSNALEHGVLKLNSQLKASPVGFAEYYAQRTQRLAELSQGYVEFAINHEKTPEGGVLTINVADSGPGFPYEKITCETDQYAYCGRGISLVGSLCESFRYLGLGNQVEVVYRWIDETG